MLTCSVLPCVGRGLSYGIMKAGMRGRLAFCTFPDARESRICDVNKFLKMKAGEGHE